MTNHTAHTTTTPAASAPGGRRALTASLAPLLALGLAGVTTGCAMDTDGAEIDEVSALSDPGQLGCGLDGKRIVFQYTEGDAYFTAVIRAEESGDPAPIEAGVEARWLLDDGSRGERAYAPRAFAFAESGGDEVEIPMLGEGTYTVEVTAASPSCGSITKSLRFLPPLEEPKAEGPIASADGCLTGVTVYGSGSADVLNGGPGNDTLYGYGGRDTLRGRKCNDWEFGGGGSDTLFGADGDDHLDGGSEPLIGGHDDCTGGPGNDQFIDCENITP